MSEQNNTNNFDEAAATWDEKPQRVEMAKKVAQAVLHEAQPDKKTEVLDYGCGTGLVAFHLAPHVKIVIGADSSTGMLEVLQQKIEQHKQANVRALFLDLEKDRAPENCCDLLVSNMTMHHVGELKTVLQAFHTMLRPGGRLCVADLDKEPGIFHGPNPEEHGVKHFGFERNYIKQLLQETGFSEPKDTTAHVLRKELDDGSERDFPMFLVTARK
jgi:ubiquinone/menaquinone biosynthesis C-methylase UbiE